MNEEERIEEIERLLDAEGRKLLLVEDEDGWEAIFPIKHFGSAAPAARGSTRLAAAEAAWAMYQAEPHLGGGGSET